MGELPNQEPRSVVVSGPVKGFRTDVEVGGGITSSWTSRSPSVGFTRGRPRTRCSWPASGPARR